MEHFEFIKKHLGNAKIVLDVGAGSGRFLEKLVKETGVKGVGIDPYITPYSEGNLELIPLRAEDVDKLPYKFDMAYSIHSFHHISKPNEFLTKLPGILKPSGVFIIIDWKKGANTGIPERYYSRKEFEDMLTFHGFKINEIYETSMEIFIVATKEEKQ